MIQTKSVSAVYGRSTRTGQSRLLKSLLGVAVAVMSGSLVAAEVVANQDSPQAKTARAAQEDSSTQALPVPDKKQQTEVLKLIRSLFKEQYADRSNQGRAALIESLIKQGSETNDDDTARFVLYHEAIEIAKKTGDLPSAWTAVEAIIANYDVDPYESKLAVLRDLVKRTDDPSAFSPFVGECQALIQTDINLDQYDSANEKSRKLLAIAKKGTTKATIENISNLISQIKKLKAGYAAIQNHLVTLQKEPTNEDANQIVGEFHCFEKGDFETGLPFLQKGNKEITKNLAKLELAPPSNTKDGLKLADGWWNYAVAEKRNERTFVHSIRCYEKCVDSTKGITKKRIETRINEWYADLFPKLNFGPEQLFEITWEGGVVWAMLRFEKDEAHIETNSGVKFTFPFQIRENKIIIYNKSQSVTYWLTLRGDEIVASAKLLSNGNTITGQGKRKQ